MGTSRPLKIGPTNHEFVGSGLAIFAAIVVTWREKKIVTDCYIALETLNVSLDRLFEEGVGEDYLYRLVRASEKNSANTAALKDALIEDLSKLMHEVADKQISAVSASNQNIAQTRTSKTAVWNCLCCESAKLRSPAEAARLRQKARNSPRLNLKF